MFLRSRARGSNERGYVLVATTLALLFLFGVSGLAVDIGRMYITKKEAQAYVDSASLAAAMQLDGTSGGITRATSAATNASGTWQFSTQSFTNVTTSFGTGAAGPFTTSPPNPPTGYNYVQVAVSVNLPMVMIRLLTGPTASIGASAVSAATAMTTMPSGVFPFSPYTRSASPDNPSDPYGYQIGNDYTLRWGAPGNNTDCGTDATSPNLSSNGSIRGYCCVFNSASSLRQSIVSAKTDSVTIGQGITMDTGAKNTEMSAIGDRVAIDTDTTSATYAAYVASGMGNGARIVVVPVNGGAPNYLAIGFAAFFLLPSSYYSGLKGNDSACAEYIGAWTEGERAPPAAGSGGYHIRLLR